MEKFCAHQKLNGKNVICKAYMGDITCRHTSIKDRMFSDMPCTRYENYEETQSGLEIHRLLATTSNIKDIKDRKKTFEIRRNDRIFKIGDIIVLTDKSDESNSISVVVNYIETYNSYENYVVLGIELAKDNSSDDNMSKLKAAVAIV